MILGFVKDLFSSVKLEEAIKKLGHPVIIASSEAAFAKRLQEARPPLIIVDLTMDDVDLEQLLKGLKENPETAKVPILACTTHADWKRSRPFERWCDRMVTKDALSKHLPELIEGYLKQERRGHGAQERGEDHVAGARHL